MQFNPTTNLTLEPPNYINVYILLMVLHLYFMVLVVGICSNIKTFYLWSVLSSFILGPVCFFFHHQHSFALVKEENIQITSQVNGEETSRNHQAYK